MAPPLRPDRDGERLRLLTQVIAQDGGPFVDRIHRTLALAADLLGYQIGLLSRVQGTTYTVVASHAPEAEITAGDVFDLGDTYCAMTLGCDDLLEIDYAGRSPHRAHPGHERFGLESYLGAPIRVDGNACGTLSFSSRCPRAAALPEADRNVVRILAAWIGGVWAGEQRERALHDQHGQIRTIVDHTPIVLFGADADGVITVSEGAGLAANGVEPRQMIGENVFDLYADRPEVADTFRRVLSGSLETWEGHDGGSFLLNRARPVFGPNGAVTGLIGVSYDLTEQHRAEVAARTSLERFRAVAESATDAIVTADVEGVITSWNAAATRTFGYEAEAAVGQPVTLVLPEWSCDAQATGVDRYRPGADPSVPAQTVRLRGRRASGETFPLDVSLSPWGTGDATELLAVLRDVSRPVERELAESEERFRALSEATFEGIAYSDNGVITDCNEQFAWLFGYARVEDMVGRLVTGLCAPEYAERVREMNATNRTESYEVVNVRRDGSRFWAEIQGRPAPLDGRLFRITAIRDITARKRAEEQRRFQADVLAHVSDAVIALDLDGRITYWNAGAERLHGHNANEVLGRHLDEVVTYLVPDDGSGVPEASPSPEAALQSEAATAGELIYVGPDGKRRFVSVSSSTLRDEDGEERGLLAVSRDVTAQRELSVQLRHQATHDVLTGLPNRALFRQRIAAGLADATPFAVLFIDLDHFKAVNDSLGHDAGDRLLTTIAHRLREALGAAEGALVARLGGDEFGVFVPTDSADPEAVGQTVLRALDAPVDLGARAVTPSASVGAVSNGERYQTPEDLLRDADTAMYAAKHGGRGRLSRFDRTVHTAADLRLGTEQDLHAVERDQIPV